MLRHRAGIRPARKTHKFKTWKILASLFIAAVVCTLCIAARAWGYLQRVQPAETASGIVNDLLLHAVVQECMRRQPTVIIIHAEKGQRVYSLGTNSQLRRYTADAACPLFFIPLAEGDRSIGLCTDAALYVQLLGARIVPDSHLGLEEAKQCGVKSAVLFLEPLYDPWINWLVSEPKVVVVYAPNFEHVFVYDKDAHKRMQLILCKVYRCNELMDAYIKDISSEAILVYTGHTSLDPLALASQPRQFKPRRHLKPADDLRTKAGAAAAAAHQQIASLSPQTSRHSPRAGHQTNSALPLQHLAAAVERLSALHVRGKSSLKHTKQLLNCWLRHPDWPQLTVLGPMPNEQITLEETRRYLAAGNIAVPRPGKPSGPGWPTFDPISGSELSTLLLSHPLHVMPSEREGFGHTINEGRAAGALLLVPDHPPMNELVQPGVGVMIEPQAKFSHNDGPVPALGSYANISVSISPEGICDAVAHALSIPPQQRTAMGMKARQLFEADRRNFEQRIQQVKILVQKLVATAAAPIMEGIPAA